MFELKSVYFLFFVWLWTEFERIFGEADCRGGKQFERIVTTGSWSCSSNYVYECNVSSPLLKSTGSDGFSNAFERIEKFRIHNTEDIDSLRLHGWLSILLEMSTLLGLF